MLENKTALITGGAKGIGKAIALELAKNGANIAINYRSSIESELIKELESYNVKVVTYKCEVQDFEATKEMVEKVQADFGTIDILVNNAGITDDMLILKMKEEQFDNVIDVNLKGTFNLTRHVSNIMLKQKSGAIINITSVIGLIGNAGQSNYAASKAGIIGLTKSIARELGSRGITVNAIAPGFIETDMTEVLSDKIKETILTQIPLKKLGQSEDVARAVVFLATNKYITGQVLNVDGGMVMN